MNGFFVFYILILMGWGVLWGFATNKIIQNKGYEQNWFLWGFFFGFIAFIVALTKPENNAYKVSRDVYGAANLVRTQESYDSQKELVNLEKLKQYKDLLDSGVITQEEFDKKKKELLNL